MRVCAAVCRHCVPLKAVNFVKTGERFAYSHYLCTKYFYPQKVKVLHMDIQCKFRKWEEKVTQKVLDSTDPAVQSSDCMVKVAATADAAQRTIKVLSEAHGKLHDRNCQVLSIFLPCHAFGTDIAEAAGCRFSTVLAGLKVLPASPEKKPSSSFPWRQGLHARPRMLAPSPVQRQSQKRAKDGRLTRECASQNLLQRGQCAICIMHIQAPAGAASECAFADLAVNFASCAMQVCRSSAEAG